MLNAYKKLAKRIAFKSDGYPYWTASKISTLNGAIAGTITSSHGYRSLHVVEEGKHLTILAHRLLWYQVHGYIPIELDHIDRDRDHNVISNLREVTSGQNNYNRGKKQNTTSKYLGVYWDKSKSRWRAQLQIDKKNIRLGNYKVEEEAAQAYNKAVTQHNLEQYIDLNILPQQR